MSQFPQMYFHLNADCSNNNGFALHSPYKAQAVAICTLLRFYCLNLKSI